MPATAMTPINVAPSGLEHPHVFGVYPVPHDALSSLNETCEHGPTWRSHIPVCVPASLRCARGRFVLLLIEDLALVSPDRNTNLDLNVRYWRWSQPIDATQALNLSAGVSNSSVLRGRSFS